MKCTSCGNPVRPVVAIDIDGTLGDYHGHLTDFMADYWDQPVPGWEQRYRGRESMREWACRTFGITASEYRASKLAYRQGGGKRTMPPYSGAVGLCAAVRDAGAELWLTTTRPYLRLDSTDPDTRFWLDRHGVAYDHLLYDDDKYHRLAEIVEPARIVAVLDDLPEMVEQANEVIRQGVGMYRINPYNPEAGPGLNTPSLHAARVGILIRLREWKENHADHD